MKDQGSPCHKRKKTELRVQDISDLKSNFLLNVRAINGYQGTL